MEMFKCLCIALVFFISLTQGCRLWMCNAPDHHALLVKSDGTAFLYPDVVKESGTHCTNSPNSQNHFKAIDIGEDESVIAACPGEAYENLPENKFKNFEESSLTLTCSNGQLLNNDKSIDWSDLECNRKLKPSFIISDKSCGNQQGNIITIDWKVDKKMFTRQIEICFNREKESTLYEHHFLHGRYIDAKTIAPGRPDFINGEEYSTDIETLYGKENQELVFDTLLGRSDHLEVQRFQRGHLAPDADFVTEAEQDATYYFVNVVPQWEKFNTGNWKKLEIATRKLAIEKEQKLSIWTGTHEVLHLPDGQGNSIPIYLGLLGNKNIVAIPKLMWKVVYIPDENQSVVFIGLNDSRESNNNDVSIICQDICSEIKWMDWKTDQNDAAKGKMICCSLHDAKRVIPTLPELDDIHNEL